MENHSYLEWKALIVDDTYREAYFATVAWQPPTTQKQKSKE